MVPPYPPRVHPYPPSRVHLHPTHPPTPTLLYRQCGLQSTGWGGAQGYRVGLGLAGVACRPPGTSRVVYLGSVDPSQGGVQGVLGSVDPSQGGVQGVYGVCRPLRVVYRVYMGSADPSGWCTGWVVPPGGWCTGWVVPPGGGVQGRCHQGAARVPPGTSRCPTAPPPPLGTPPSTVLHPFTRLCTFLHGFAPVLPVLPGYLPVLPGYLPVLPGFCRDSRCCASVIPAVVGP